ncbi:NAD-dependent succinate-semialdehyde dehydrogenase [Burkholderia sp. 3C]
MKLKDETLLRSHGIINGLWMGAHSGATHEVRNPATGELITTVPDMGEAETRAAIDAANQALPAWRAKTAKERSVILRRWYDLMLENEDDLALIMTLEQGKPLAEARGEVRYGAAFVEWFAEEAKRVYGDVIPAPSADKRIIVIKQPVGVTAAITPWNFPIAMITRKVGPALAAGCTSVVKPAEATPLSALAIAELGIRAGIPAGVLNIVTTARPAVVGEVLTSSPIVRKISFTGSTAVGKKLMAQSAGTVKRVSLELGGNAPFIVFDDADVEAAVKGAIASKYRNAGQTCVCANRFLVQSGIYDKFVTRLAEVTAAMAVDNGLVPGVEIGPLINEAAVAKVERLVAAAVESGAKVALGGSRHEKGRTFYMPTILTDVTASMDISSEEIFGPVATIFRFQTEEEAVALANDTPFGLAAYFYTKDIHRVWRVTEALEYGIVGANEGLISTEVAPFGGMKESGTGREGSKYGIDEYLEIKYLCLGGN